jgi:hypothetical protein
VNVSKAVMSNGWPDYTTGARLKEDTRQAPMWCGIGPAASVCEVELPPAAWGDMASRISTIDDERVTGYGVSRAEPPGILVNRGV